MRRIVVELTDRCNLSCQHCFAGRHGGSHDLPLEVLQRVLAEARAHGFGHLSFTGGDPTVHPQFLEALRLSREAGYDYSFVTNGWNFVSIYERILPYRDRLTVVTFSLDGATEATHDQLRGKGSFRRALRAMSVCIAEDIPFTINMVITAHNRHQLGEMVELAARLGSLGLRLCHLMPSPRSAALGLDLSPADRKAVEAEVALLGREATLPVVMAPGYHTTELFPCAPLQLEEVNVDCRGNLTKCCHLSGHGPGTGHEDVVGSLLEMSFSEAYLKLVEDNQRFREYKAERLRQGRLADADLFACWYCSLYYGKARWLKRVAGHPWGPLVWERGPVATEAGARPVKGGD